MAGTPATTGRCIPAWPKDALRITFGVIWLIDAIRWPSPPGTICGCGQYSGGPRGVNL
jgi:hypothetical protein